ncbi:hypothetical protein ACFY0A_44325 [Streptomyces sp. NPDC001698]|uniref:hypothetical protein n=1 Tax=unclassified Streptomyces TaxID=2593676 RepID=UPI0036C69877
MDAGGAHDLGDRFFRAVVDDLRGDGHEPWQEPSPQQVRPLKDAPGKPVEDGDW